MLARRLLLLAALWTTSLFASSAHAQCATWLPGPLDNGTAPNGTDGTVRAMTLWDPSGSGLAYKLVIAGQFAHVQGVAANNIAVFDPGVGVWQPLGAGTNDIVNALTVYNNQLVAGGNFTQVDGQPMNYAAMWDGATWTHMDNGVNIDGPPGPVNCFTIWNNAVTAAGAYRNPNFPSQLLNYIDTWTSSATGWTILSPVVPGCNGGNCGSNPAPIHCLAQYNGSLIAGGEFTLTNGVTTNYTARFVGPGWVGLGSGFNGTVTSLQPWNGLLIAGGRFSQFIGSGGTVGGMGAWNGTSWSTMGTGMVGDVEALTVFNSALIAMGNFSSAGGVAASKVAAWNGSSWSALGAGLSTSFSSALVGIPYNGELVVGGTFSLAGGNPANNIARWNGTEWSSYGGGSANAVYSETQYLGRAILGGDFHQSTTTTSAHSIAGWDGSKLYPFGTGMNGPVYSLKAFKYPGIFGSNELIAGGLFTVAGGVAATRIARWNQSDIIISNPAWQAMGAGFNGAVLAIERYNNVTYAGGTFTASGATPTSFIAKWNETTKVWEPVSTGMNGAVRALRVYNGFLYAGGDFTTAGGVGTGGFARFDGTSWTANGGFFSGSVNALEIYSGLLVIGGLYPGINSSPNLAYYTGSAYGTFATGGTSDRVRSISVVGTRMYIGGDFGTAGGVTSPHVAYWDGAWHAAAGGVDDINFALTNYHNELLAGGFFLHENAGALASPRSARYSDGRPWISQQPSSQGVPWGGNASFTVVPAAGFSGLTFQWFKDGVALANGPTGIGATISGVTAATLTLAGVGNPDIGTYSVRVSNACGSDSSFGATLNLSGTTAVTPGGPGATVLDAIAPNPTPGAATVSFTLARAGEVRITVSDVAGRRVRTLAAGASAAGRHTLLWDARGDDGARVRAGMYFVTLSLDGRTVGARRVTMIH